MKLLTRVLAALYHRINILLLRIYFLYIELTKEVIYVQYSVYGKNLKLNNRNFGDDINKVLLEELFKINIVPYKFCTVGKIKEKTKYMCIGSVITMFDLTNTIIWGTGVLSSKFSIKGFPVQVCAVRGPLTRDVLVSKGIECPKIYGDPALLLPKIYKPNIKQKYKLGIIAHYLDHNDYRLNKILNDNKTDVIFIDVVNYGHWHDFIDKILSCDFILSSSLHGLIISDAYNIPNIWCQFRFQMDDDGFKFRDYFSSVKREIVKPLLITECISLDNILELKKNWKPIDIDLNKLYEVCPFKK